MQDEAVAVQNDQTTADEQTTNDQQQQQEEKPVLHVESQPNEQATAVTPNVYNDVYTNQPEKVMSVVMVGSGHELQITNRISMGDAVISVLLFILIMFLILKSLLDVAWKR